jgi:hypothetical protein
MSQACSVVDAQFVPGEGAQLGQVLFGERTGAAGQVFQEGDHVSGLLAIFGTSETSAKASEVEQLGFLVAQLQQLGDVAGCCPTRPTSLNTAPMSEALVALAR